MATVTLRGIYLAPIADLTDVLHLNAGVELSDGPDARAEGRRYAGGRVRLIGRVGKDRGLAVRARRIDRATREQLDEWAGVPLLLRDGRGRKVYGFYSAPQFTEQPGLPVCDVALTFVEISHDEAV